MKCPRCKCQEDVVEEQVEGSKWKLGEVEAEEKRGEVFPGEESG